MHLGLPNPGRYHRTCRKIWEAVGFPHFSQAISSRFQADFPCFCGTTRPRLQRFFGHCHHRAPVLGAAMASVDDVPRDLEGSFLAKKADVCGVFFFSARSNWGCLKMFKHLVTFSWKLFKTRLGLGKLGSFRVVEDPLQTLQPAPGVAISSGG